MTDVDHPQRNEQNDTKTKNIFNFISNLKSLAHMFFDLHLMRFYPRYLTKNILRKHEYDMMRTHT